MIQIIYNPATLDDFKSAVEFMKDKGVASIAPSIRPPVEERGDEPNVKRYLTETGQSRFRLSEVERASGLSREEAAAIRLKGLSTDPLEVPEDLAQSDEDFSIFGAGA
jgi:hypothetical protein